jgi:hypothetical protein
MVTGAGGITPGGQAWGAAAEDPTITTSEVRKVPTEHEAGQGLAHAGGATISGAGGTWAIIGTDIAGGVGMTWGKPGIIMSTRAAIGCFAPPGQQPLPAQHGQAHLHPARGTVIATFGLAPQQPLPAQHGQEHLHPDLHAGFA